MSTEPEVILSIAGEGGGITLLGRRKADASQWEFARRSTDHSMALLGTGPGEEGEPDPEVRPPAPVWVDRWQDAIALIDNYAWVLLRPLTVHPEFRELVLVDVAHRLMNGHPRYAHYDSNYRNAVMERWLQVCDGGRRR